MVSGKDGLQFRKIRIRGTVQGVGFRPFVYRLATRLGIRGGVKNDAGGVEIEACGRADVLDRLVDLLRREAPPLAAIRSIDVEELVHRDPVPVAFVIRESAAGGSPEIDCAVDTAVCDVCLAEMRDPRDRRFNHAFINCTDCGPRYTIISSVPYDRPNTSMAGFVMCEACRREYSDPLSRRFHAQPICCPSCGPQLSLLDDHGMQVATADPVAATIGLLDAGRIVAIKGIGGYHLACRADSTDPVVRLRSRKYREEKPFALMVRDLPAAGSMAALSSEEARLESRLLESPARPIVLVAKRSGVTGIVADEVAPGLPTLGIMLPYAPLHHLLFDRSTFSALIMTSGNRSDEPMAHADHDARAMLSGIADAFLTHDRPIVARTDDSIARIAAGQPLLLRRGRGFVPDPLPSPVSVQGIVGCGGVLKSTVTVGRGTSCYVSQYVGNAESAGTLLQLEEIKNHLLALLGVEPSLFVLDLHPHTPIARIASDGIPRMRIQHHHAHAAACLAENRVEGRAVCVVYDGTGFGEDGTLWGGEFFVADRYRFSRAGHLLPLLLPGGEAAILNPWRIAIGALFPLIGEECEELCQAIPLRDKRAVIEMVAKESYCVRSTGMGRLFDAMSALLGICSRRTYEGQPAIMLEAVADPAALIPGDPHFAVDATGNAYIDGAKILLDGLAEFRKGVSAPVVAARFHATIAESTALAAARIASVNGTDVVALSGGCFQNRLLLEGTAEALGKKGLTPVVHRLVPPNDEAVSYGQAVIAGMRRNEIK